MKHSTITKNDIKVLGRVVSITSTGVVASAEQIWDDKFDLINGLTPQANHDAGPGANQYNINRLFANKLIALSELFDTDASGNVVFNNRVSFNGGIRVSGNSIFDGDVELTSGHDLVAPNGQFQNISVSNNTTTRNLVATSATIADLTVTDLEVVNDMQLDNKLTVNYLDVNNAINTDTINGRVATFNTINGTTVNAGSVHIGTNDTSCGTQTLTVHGSAKFECGVTVDGPVTSSSLDNKYRLTIQQSSGSCSDHNGSYDFIQGGTTVGTVDISDWFLAGGSIQGTTLKLILNDPSHTEVSIDLSSLIGQNSITIQNVIANSNLGTPQAGDILYFNGTTWTLTPLRNLLYWTLDAINHTIVPNTANTNNYVDVATTGSIYSGALGPQQP